MKNKRRIYNEKAASIQRAWFRFKKEKTQNLAATTIQSHFRGFMARKSYLQLVQEKTQVHSSVE